MGKGLRDSLNVFRQNDCGFVGEGSKSGKRMQEKGRVLFLLFSVLLTFRTSTISPTVLRTSGRSGDEFRHVRQKLGREGGQEGHETGKAITQKHRCGHVGRVSLIE